MGVRNFFLNSRINYFKEIKNQQENEVKELKRRVAHLELSVDQRTKERDSIYGDLNVNITECSQLF